MHIQRKILRPAQAAARLGIGYSTLNEWDRKGLLCPKVKIGPRAVGYFEDELLDLIAQRPIVGGAA